ncbi:MAG: class I SAM-dependent methyltransferase [Candidatus Hodarchaeales archaeon]|jgi:methyltransferase (TIGR00027 family)
MDPKLQAFATEFTMRINPQVEGIVEVYQKDPEKGLSAYFDFIKRVEPFLAKIIKNLKNPREIGLISPRLLRDPLSIDLKSNRITSEEKEAHVVGYLKAIIQLAYCVAKGLEGRQFYGTSLHEESLRTQNIGKINILPPLVQIVKQEIVETDSSEHFTVVIKERKKKKEKQSIDVPPPKIPRPELNVHFNSIDAPPPKIPRPELSLHLKCDECNLSVPFPRHCNNLEMTIKNEKHMVCEVCKKTIAFPIHHEKEMKVLISKKEHIDINKMQTQSPKEQKLDYKSTTVPFTARLMAYYRAQECKKNSPLIVDPFAERLAGDMTSYIDEHKHFSQSDYPLVRSYFIEENLLTPWCNTHTKSQIVLLGAGLDTRAYRFKPLQSNSHIIYEIDFDAINNHKEEILKDDQPFCDLKRISTDLSKHNWFSHLIKRGFSNNILTFWVLEGLVYYIEQEVVTSILKKASEISTKNSQIFVDICVPALAELRFGPFTRHFKWGLDKKAIPSFFATAGWNVSCSFADDFDQGRDVGQRGLIFVHGVRAISA